MGGPLLGGEALFAMGFVTGIIFVSFITAPLIAWQKGFVPYYWMFACGPVGLFVICCLRSLKAAKTPEEYERMEARANLFGSVLTGIALFASVSLTGLLVLPLFV